MKHTIIREIQFHCEIKLKGCMISESFTPLAHQTYKDSEKNARTSGWCIIKGKTCCPICAYEYNNPVRGFLKRSINKKIKDNKEELAELEKELEK